jgi:hypothetical protein
MYMFIASTLMAQDNNITSRHVRLKAGCSGITDDPSDNNSKLRHILTTHIPREAQVFGF